MQECVSSLSLPLALTALWSKRVAELSHAFQPIVNVHTGLVFGFEALLRHVDRTGFASIQHFFDAAARDWLLFGVDMALRKKAIEKFVQLAFYQDVQLFYNLDNRILSMPDYSPEVTLRLLERVGLAPCSVCFEISERHTFDAPSRSKDILRQARKTSLKIAIDDFGAGFAGLQLLYEAEPDFIKIDRFFIDGIATDNRKKLFVRKMVDLSHVLGIKVVAEGVETEREYQTCRDIGCDFVQGYFVCRPTLDITELKPRYEPVAHLANLAHLDGADRRHGRTDSTLVLTQMESIPAMSLPGSTMVDVFEAFRKRTSASFVPVVDAHQAPLGIIREADLKEYVYSPYGRSLLMNKTQGKDLADFVVKVPVCELSSPLDQILEAFTLSGQPEGVLLTERGSYLGFLSARALLSALHEMHVGQARDQNPLTRLPGNSRIDELLARSLSEAATRSVFVYFDFDHFKPFNDTYGFRQGDRVILLFADMLRQWGRDQGAFVAHVGGDDFFAAFHGTARDDTDYLTAVTCLTSGFRHDVLALYSPEHRDAGGMQAVDRDGVCRKFPLLSVSAAVVVVEPAQRPCQPHHLDALLADAKKRAKGSSGGVTLARLEPR